MARDPPCLYGGDDNGRPSQCAQCAAGSDELNDTPRERREMKPGRRDLQVSRRAERRGFCAVAVLCVRFSRHLGLYCPITVFCACSGVRGRGFRRYERTSVIPRNRDGRVDGHAAHFVHSRVSAIARPAGVCSFKTRDAVNGAECTGVSERWNGG